MVAIDKTNARSIMVMKDGMERFKKAFKKLNENISRLCRLRQIFSIV